MEFLLRASYVLLPVEGPEAFLGSLDEFVGLFGFVCIIVLDLNCLRAAVRLAIGRGAMSGHINEHGGSRY